MASRVSQQHGRSIEEQDGTYLTVNDGFGEVEFTNHAERDGATAGLGVVELAFEEDGVDALLLGEDLGGARARRTTTDDCDLVLHAQGRRRRGGAEAGLAAHEGRGGGGEGGDGGGRSRDESDTDLHGW